MKTAEEVQKRELKLIKEFHPHTIAYYYMRDRIKCKYSSLKRLCTKKGITIPSIPNLTDQYEQLAYLENIYKQIKDGNTTHNHNL